MAITARIIGGDTLLLRCFYVLFTAFTDFYGINNKQILLCVLNIYSTYCVCFTMAKHLVKVRNKFFVCWKTPVSFIHLMQCCSILMAINLEFIAHVAIKTFYKCNKVCFSNLYDPRIQSIC